MRRLFTAVFFLALAACAPQGNEGGVEPGAPLYDGLRAGTIKTGESLYMIPLKEVDRDGCQGYRQYSPDHMVTMAIYYREEGGGFTANKLQATCYAKD